MIRLQSLHKFFNKGRQNEIHVINDVSLELPERGMVAIFGKSGCGKTTLLNVIGGLDRFASGQVSVEGKDIREDTDDLRNRYIGYIFQNYNLNRQETCFDNVADALRLCGMEDGEEMETRVMAALSNVGMQNYRNRTPDTLSGGQQQRIAIARAIVKNPPVILADEPTGNLDEANTVMIMDLLKQIARDHLVLLVTHEANLVDYYCDTVIELSDGRVVAVRENGSANGFAARDRNDVYLGELSRTELKNGNAEIVYYGETPDAPIKLRIVNCGGKTYVQIDSPDVQVLDEFSEVKLREGVFEEKPHQNEVSKSIDMSQLPPVVGKRYGRLFTFRSSLKSGYDANFKNRKKGKRLLRGCMCLFAAVLVMMSAVFGSGFADILNARAAYNHNVFYVYTPDPETSQKLNEAVGQNGTGIDYLRLSYDYPRGDAEIKLMTGFFETFSTMPYDESFRTNAVYLDMTLARELPLVAGKADGLTTEEVLITTTVADALLETSTLGYISERKDLIGMITTSMTVDGRNLRVAGIVESDETAVYLTETAMAKYVMQFSPTNARLAAEYGIQVEAGETVLMLREKRAGIDYPKVGEYVTIHGRELLVSEILECYASYEDWMKANGIQMRKREAYYLVQMSDKYPELVQGSDDYNAKLSEIRRDCYYDYYDYYYTELDAFLQSCYRFAPDSLELWLAVEKGLTEARLYFAEPEYYRAVCYKAANGRYPTPAELLAEGKNFPSADVVLEESTAVYKDEFYNSKYVSNYVPESYLVNDADYIAFSKQIGKTDPSALSEWYKDTVVEEGVSARAYSASVEIMVETVGGTAYTVVHSSNPKETETWLRRECSDLDTGSDYLLAILAPDDIFDNVIHENREQILVSLITMAVILLVMSVCMYFIMRSSLMNRIKEVGIYRAIGVSKKNLVFRFLVESVVLTTLTVLIGYLLTSAFLGICLGISPLVKNIFYYPVWLALADLAILYALCILCGTLPITSLLRKTPSEILAKYDI